VDSSYINYTSSPSKEWEVASISPQGVLGILSQLIAYYNVFQLLFDNNCSFQFMRNYQKKRIKKKKRKEKKTKTAEKHTHTQ
jgi:hypothetical protein